MQTAPFSWSTLPTEPKAEPYWSPTEKKMDGRFYVHRLVEDPDRPRCARSMYLHEDLSWQTRVDSATSAGLYASEEAAKAMIARLATT
jgi:hypothetical protein